jgi:thymidine kinase
MTATVINSANEIFTHVKNGVKVIGIDEGQFFDNRLIEVCKILARQGKRVIIAGLDKTFDDQPFAPMPQLAAIADYCEKYHAICIECGQKASFSQRLTASSEKIQVGGKSQYAALCRSCYNKKNCL